jgi:Leucine-rich repeat (LRR) protein
VALTPNPSVGTAFPQIPVLDAAAIKAVRNSLPGKLLGRTAAILSIVVLVLGFAELAGARMAHMGLLPGPPWLNYALLIGVPALIIAVQLLNEWEADRNRRKAIELAIKPALVPDEYFRIGPYLDTVRDRAAFVRADHAHERALEWLRQSTSVPLYLTGDSGSGKTSLLNAFVIPTLGRDGLTVISVRAGQDVDAALRKALTAPDTPHNETMRALIAGATERSQHRLLIVLDQFEEFLILATPERHKSFAAMIADLAAYPIPGLKILLALRSDYQTRLDEIGLPRLLQGENFFQVGRFGEEAARTFFRSSNLGLKDEPLDRLLKSAAELDDTPGMIRPITLNVLGFVLRQRGGAMASVDAGTLVRGYIAQTVENPAIRAWAPVVLEGMLTEQQTKRPRSEANLATDAKLRTGEVRAVLLALAEAALARPLEPTQGVWELSHDFVARAVSRYLGRRRGAPLRRATAYAAPALLALGIITGLVAVELHRIAPAQAKAELADLGITIETQKDGLHAIVTDTFEPDRLAAIVPLLETLPVVALDLSETQVTNLEPLKALTALQQLDLYKTQVADLEPLQALTALQQLDLSNTRVANLEPLEGLTGLQQLYLSNTRVANLEPLKQLTALQQLYLASTRVANLGPLKQLTELQQLDLSGTQVAELEPLKGLTSLQDLSLSGTQVAELEPLKQLTALQQLYLATTRVANLEPLKQLTALQQLDLSDTQVAELEPLKGLTSLQDLSLSGTQVAELEPLKGLTALRKLNLANSRVAELEPLKGLTLLQQLNLANTRVTNLEPLKGLTALRQLGLANTQVAELEPLKRLTALQELYVFNTRVATLEPLKGLTALQKLNLANTQVTNLEPLKQLTALQQLNLANTQVPDSEVVRVLSYRSRNGLAEIKIDR